MVMGCVWMAGGDGEVGEEGTGKEMEEGVMYSFPGAFRGTRWGGAPVASAKAVSLDAVHGP
jgi:hypothetical protein